MVGSKGTCGFVCGLLKVETRKANALVFQFTNEFMPTQNHVI